MTERPGPACQDEIPDAADQIPIAPENTRISAVTRSTIGTAGVAWIKDIGAAFTGVPTMAGCAPRALRMMFDNQAMSFLANHLPSGNSRDSGNQ